jgi:hypothetical protein
MSTDPTTQELVPGGSGPWERPWAFRCDRCDRTLPYGVALYRHDRRTSRDEARCVGSERAVDGENHLCGDCEGFTEQLGLFS